MVDGEDAAAEGLGERGLTFALRALARLVHHDTTSEVCWGFRRFVRACTAVMQCPALSPVLLCV